MIHLPEMRRIKAGLILVAISIAAASLYISHNLTRDLSHEETVRMELWAEAVKAISAADDDGGMNLVLKVLNTNDNIPVVVTDKYGSIQMFRNIDVAGNDTAQVVGEKLAKFRRLGNVIRMDIDTSGSDYIDICYGNSYMLTRLSVFPYVQLGVVLVFFVVAVFALLSSKRAEQNRVWVGLSKETAHQLGTPISSLMAWVELLKSQYPEDELIPCMSDDVERLQTVASRFSKIGSSPELLSVDLCSLLQSSIAYMRTRTSDKVKFNLVAPADGVMVNVNPQLFGWVIENLFKNAIDAMEGAGTITVSVSARQSLKWLYIDVIDTGRGIEKSKQKSVFSPGYTTKSRGWGLGLSLARRIVEDYHSGHIFVKQSEQNKGTTFRIELKK